MTSVLIKGKSLIFICFIFSLSKSEENAERNKKNQNWLFLAALWSPTTIHSLVCDVFLRFCHFLIWCPGSGVVIDCIDS